MWFEKCGRLLTPLVVHNTEKREKSGRLNHHENHDLGCIVEMYLIFYNQPVLFLTILALKQYLKILQQDYSKIQHNL